MDEHELLLRHAERWASERNRVLDVELLDEVLRLRSVHDGLAANRWPPRSVTHLMLTRWPAHGPLDPPDVPTLLATLETFWRFLRNTGRMAGGSADPGDLAREAKSASRRMAAACADPANFGQSKQLFSFGREIGITLDDVADSNEANQRMEKIVEAWNALPAEERLRRTPSSGNAGSRMGRAITEAADQLHHHGELPAGWQLPEPPRLDDPSDDERMFPSDPAVSAPQLRASGFVQQVLALIDWVGDGRAVTGTDVLRPTVAKQAYADLGLWQWERDWLLAGGMDLPDDSRLDEVLAQTGLSGWRTAADCLALDRLWLPAVASGLIRIHGSRASADRSRVPDTDVGWAHLGQMLLLALASRSRPEGAFDPLLGILFSLCGDAGEPHTEAELAEWWCASPANALASGLPNRELARQLSDRDLHRCLVMFGDCGAWRSDGKLTGTEVGWDLALTLIAALDSGLFEEISN